MLALTSFKYLFAS